MTRECGICGKNFEAIEDSDTLCKLCLICEGVKALPTIGWLPAEIDATRAALDASEQTIREIAEENRMLKARLDEVLTGGKNVAILCTCGHAREEHFKGDFVYLSCQNMPCDCVLFTEVSLGQTIREQCAKIAEAYPVGGMAPYAEELRKRIAAAIRSGK
jgi:hypothetical protein